MNWAFALMYICAVRWLITFFFFIAIPFCSMGQDSLLVNLAADTNIVTDSIAQDSIFQKRIVAPEKPTTVEGKSRSSNKKGTFFFLGLGVFLLFGLVRFAYQKYIDALFTTIARSTLWRLSVNERLWQNINQRLFFLCIYFLSAGYVAGRVIDYYGKTDLSDFSTWMFGSAIALGAFIGKYLILQSVALVFRFTKVANTFFRHIMVINQVMGVILLPICGILLLAPGNMTIILLIATIVLLAASMLFKYLINIAYVRNLPKVNYMHFIVYLCTLEFIPLAVLVRYAYDGFGV